MASDPNTPLHEEGRLDSGDRAPVSGVALPMALGQWC